MAETPKATILIVDDERLIRWSLVERLSAEGYETLEAESGQEALARFGAAVDLVLLDYRLGDLDGLEVLKALRRRDPDVLIIFFTAFSSLGNAVEVMKQGAYHYATKPFNLDEIVLLVEKALETTRLRREVRALRARQQGPYTLDRIIGDSPAAAATRDLLGKVASSPASTVLLTGESGTGKDLAARVIHDTSARAARPFMNVTCSALTETLLESELFGHERGAFTDARERKRGLLESAAGGTVFLDEIGEMSLALQAKLLRFLEEKTFKRVGGAEDVHVDVRVIAATNRNLEDDVRGRLVPGGPVLSAERAADTAPAAARPGGGRSGAGQVLRRRLQPRVPERRAGDRSRGDGSPARLRVAGQRARTAQRGRTRRPARRGRPADGGRFSPACAARERLRGSRAAARRDEPRSDGAQPGGAGARPDRLEPDPGRGAARPQPRPDSVPDREIRTGEVVAGC